MNPERAQPAPHGPDKVDVAISVMLGIFRRYRGLSQTALAQATGLSLRHIQKYEQAKGRVSAMHLYYIAQALDVSIYDFYRALPDKPSFWEDGQALSLQ